MNNQKRKLILVLSAIVFAVSMFTAFFGFTGTEYCLSVKNLIENGEKVEGVYTNYRVETPLNSPYNNELYILEIEYKSPEKTFKYTRQYTRKVGDYEFLVWCKNQIGKTQTMLCDGKMFLPENTVKDVFKSLVIRVAVAGGIGFAVALVSAILWGVTYLKREQAEASPYINDKGQAVADDGERKS